MAFLKRIRGLRRLVGELVEFAAENKAWWLIPVALILLAVAGVISLGGGAAPLIYTLF